MSWDAPLPVRLSPPRLAEVSSLWTPDGERPVRSASPPEEDRGSGAGVSDEELTEAEMEERMLELQEQLARTPAAEIVANHCFGLFELAALHLGVQPPQMAEASVAIDSLAAIVDALPGRLGDHEADIKAGVAQLRLAFVQIRAANLGASGGAASP